MTVGDDEEEEEDDDDDYITSLTFLQEHLAATGARLGTVASSALQASADKGRQVSS